MTRLTAETRRSFILQYDELPAGSEERKAMRAAVGASSRTVANWRTRLGLNPTACRCGGELVGRAIRCPACKRATARDRHLLRVYGLTRSEFDAMLADQGGVCAACGGGPSETGAHTQRVLHVDHDHETGEVRGVLCPPCNLALGCAQEDPARLIGLALYITR